MIPDEYLPYFATAVLVMIGALIVYIDRDMGDL